MKEQTDTKVNAPARQPEPDANLEMVYHLKSTIDKQGRYAYKLSDMTTGFAAGAGLSNAAARQEIENRFEKQFGRSPKDYLDHLFQERNNRRAEIERNRSKNQGRGQDRG